MNKTLLEKWRALQYEESKVGVFFSYENHGDICDISVLGAAQNHQQRVSQVRTSIRQIINDKLRK